MPGVTATTTAAIIDHRPYRTYKHTGPQHCFREYTLHGRKLHQQYELTALNDVVVGDDDRGAQLARAVITKNGKGWVKAGTAADAECETILSHKNVVHERDNGCVQGAKHTKSNDSYFREAWEKAKARIAPFFGGEKAPKKLLSYAPVRGIR